MNKRKIYNFFSNKVFLFTLISILAGLIIGAVILLFAGFNPLRAYAIIISGVLGRFKYISYTIIKATPLILTGLSITFAFRTGLFNIGAEGQFIIGAITATAVGYFLHLPAIIHIPVVIISATIAAGLWGGIAGFLKAKFGVHEVISTIMLNWIALYFQNYLVYMDGFQKPGGETSYSIQPTASIKLFGEWKLSDAGFAWFNSNPFLRDLFKTPVNFGFLFAIVAAVIVWYILKHTTLGYKLRAVGFNKNAAEYGGINVSKSMIISMTIAGGLAGLAGAVQVMGVTHNVSLLAAMEGFGFDGIAVALIGNCTAIGSVFAGLLFGALKYGGTKIQPAMGAPSEIINIVIGTIVFFIAIPRMISLLIKRFSKKDRL
ncbi:MAG: ABC transporter permease [Candidatus Cloacimonetes bacterium]|nr:ABC transporter permease [Candidatus Cloacimonadota bacterium]